MSLYSKLKRINRAARAIPPTELVIQQLQVTQREPALTISERSVDMIKRGTLYYAAAVAGSVVDVSQRLLAGYWVARSAGVIPPPPAMLPDNALTLDSVGITLDGAFLILTGSGGGVVPPPVTGNRLTLGGQPLILNGAGLILGN